MFKTLAILALMGGMAVSAGAKAPASYVQKPAVVRLEFSDGICSGTIVGAHTILSASHCFSEGGPLVSVNGKPAKQVALVNDGSDHALLTVDIAFPRWATHGGKLKQRLEVHYWGNPAGMADLYRRGYVSGFAREDGAFLLDIEGYKGDSGAGIFDGHGRLVGVVSTLWSIDNFRMIGVYPLAFTDEQWAAAL